MKKRFFTIIAVLALCLALLPGTAGAAEGDDVTVIVGGTSITAGYNSDVYAFADENGVSIVDETQSYNLELQNYYGNPYLYLFGANIPGANYVKDTRPQEEVKHCAGIAYKGNKTLYIVLKGTNTVGSVTPATGEPNQAAAIYTEKDLEISSYDENPATLLASSEAAEIKSGYMFGIDVCGDLTINKSAEVTVICGPMETGQNIGVGVSGRVYLSGNAKLTATGGVSNSCYGISCEGMSVLDNAEVIGIAKDGTELNEGISFNRSNSTSLSIGTNAKVNAIAGGSPSAQSIAMDTVNLGSNYNQPFPITMTGNAQLMVTATNAANANKAGAFYRGVKIDYEGGDVILSAKELVYADYTLQIVNRSTNPYIWRLSEEDGYTSSDEKTYTGYPRENYLEITQGYTVKAASTNTEQGTVTGGGTFKSGSEATVTATAGRGFRFVKWTKDGEEVSNQAIYTFSVTEDTSLTAVFEVQPATSISIEPSSLEWVRGEGAEQYTLEVKYEPEDAQLGEVTWSSSDPEVASVNENGVVTPGSTAGTATITAAAGKFSATCTVTVAKPEYTVSFDSQGGSPVENQTVVEGENASKPTDPSREKYSFDGWYSDETCTMAYDFNTPVTVDTVLYAKWLHIYTVTFNSQCDVSVESQTVVEGQTASEPENPTRENYCFDGWYSDEKCTEVYKFDTPVTVDTVLYAKWLHIYTVSFDSQGGDSVEDQTVAEGHPASKPADPTRTGYYFDGWYSDAECTKAYDFAAAVTGDTVLYAKWLEILPNPPADDSGSNKYQVVMEDGLSEVPSGLSGTYSTPDELQTALKAELTSAPDGSKAVYDVELMVSTDNGSTWTVADQSNFPTGGELTVTLPYPAGTNSSYTFTVVHMFTTTINSKNPGDVETPEVKNTEEGIEFTVTGLSPIAVGWTAPSAPTTPSVSYYTLASTCGEGGTISPKGYVTMIYGGTKTFTVAPDEGFAIADVLVDGESVGAVTEYTFEKVTGNHTIEAVFRKLGEWELCEKDENCAIHAFADAESNAWYHDGVHYCLENGLMTGVSETFFAPGMNASRAMIVTILWRLEGSPVVNYAMDYEDVSGDAWYAEAIRWAASEKIVNGYDNGKFGPDDAVTREQLAVMLYRYEQKYRSGGFTGEWMFLLDFADRDEVSEWAYEALCWMTMNHVMEGRGDGILDPRGNATRAEAAAMLQRFLTAE